MSCTKLVIFDCDGVLIDSEALVAEIDARALTRAGFPITAAGVLDRFTGMPWPAMCGIIEAEMGRPLPASYKEEAMAEITAAYRTDLTPIAGVADLLSALAPAFCVASSSNPAKLALGLIETGLYDALYPNVFSTRLVERGKPFPDIFLFAAEKMGAATDDCLVIEDSIAGVTAASAARMRCLGFTGGAHIGDREGHGEALRSAGAFDVIDDIRLVADFV